MVVSSVRDMTELEMLKSRMVQARELAEQYQKTLETLKEQLLVKADIVVKDEKMIDILSQTQKVAKVDTTVLLLGETGVGKEEVAKFIHENSHRNNEPFIKVNCAAIVGSLLESELFGYEKGAFTGAVGMGKMGLFEAASRGTIFLDEIGEMPLDMQAKILRAIQEKEIKRVGSIKATRIDVRIIAATNKDLKKMVEQNKFREDLYYRLSVIPITIPPLRDRSADVVYMAQKFISDFNKQYKVDVKLTNDAMHEFLAYHWPGNVRELKNTIERLVILNNSGVISKEDIPFRNFSSGIDRLPYQQGQYVNLKDIMRRFEYQYLQNSYQRTGSIRKAAELLNMKRSTFAAKLKKYN
jgi:transcriptional regulator with PAS, ATPase and Fis domain